MLHKAVPQAYNQWMTDDLKNPTHTILRGGIYYFRCRVPAGLEALYPGKSDIVQSLKTGDRREAARLARDKRHQLDLQLGSLPAVTLSPVLTLQQIKQLAVAWRSELLDEDERFRALGQVSQAYSDGLHEAAEVFSGALRRGDTAPVEVHLREFLMARGIKPSSAEDSHKRLAYAFLQEAVYVHSSLLRRERGLLDEAYAGPANPPMLNFGDVQNDRPQYSLADHLKYWAAMRSPAVKSVKDARTAIARLEHFLAGKSPASLVRRDVITFREELLTSGLSPATVKKQMGLLSAILGVAHGNERLDQNAFQGVEFPRTFGEKARIPFDTVTLQDIFNSPVYADGFRPVAGAGEAAYWLPLLALFTGARLEELGQLLVEDVRLKDGISFIRIEEESAAGIAKRLKTKGSRRVVPLHPTLTEFGFMEYVDAIRATGSLRVFPNLKFGTAEQCTASWSKWFGRYLREIVGASDRRMVFHSFRHSFKDAAREAGIPREHNDRLTGHASGDVGDAYGAQYYPLAPLMQSIKMIVYPSLCLQHLPRTQALPQVILPGAGSAMRTRVLNHKLSPVDVIARSSLIS